MPCNEGVIKQNNMPLTTVQQYTIDKMLAYIKFRAMKKLCKLFKRILNDRSNDFK